MYLFRGGFLNSALHDYRMGEALYKSRLGNIPVLLFCSDYAAFAIHCLVMAAGQAISIDETSQERGPPSKRGEGSRLSPQFNGSS